LCAVLLLMCALSVPQKKLRENRRSYACVVAVKRFPDLAPAWNGRYSITHVYTEPVELKMHLTGTVYVPPEA
jgi:hypothetical protein